MCNSSALLSQIWSFASTILIGYDELDIVETSSESRTDIIGLEVFCFPFYPRSTFITLIACKH